MNRSYQLEARQTAESPNPHRENARRQFFVACDQLDWVILELSRLPDATPFQILEAVEGAVNETLREFEVRHFKYMQLLDVENLPKSFSALCDAIQAEVAIVLTCAREAGISSEAVLRLLKSEVKEVLAPALSEKLERMSRIAA